MIFRIICIILKKERVFHSHQTVVFVRISQKLQRMTGQNFPMIFIGKPILLVIATESIRFPVQVEFFLC